MALLDVEYLSCNHLGDALPQAPVQVFLLRFYRYFFKTDDSQKYYSFILDSITKIEQSKFNVESELIRMQKEFNNAFSKMEDRYEESAAKLEKRIIDILKINNEKNKREILNSVESHIIKAQVKNDLKKK